MYKVYVLKSINYNRIYIGHTNDLSRRLKEHNFGKTKSTKGYKPWEILFVEDYKSRKKAIERERYLKSGAGREFIKNKFM